MTNASAPLPGATQSSGSDAPLQPGLYLTATPIGNAADITLRALDTLRRADILLCEDTRSTARLFRLHGIRRSGGRMRAYHDHSDAATRADILARIAAGASVALMSEAGTPLLSDPGYKLARSAMQHGLPVTCVPGACAAVAALTLSGLATDRFFFAGFPPARSAARRAFLLRLREIPGTLIFFESPRRLVACLGDMAEVLGARQGVVARELTKRFEELRRGDLPSLARICADNPARGEIVVLVEAAERERQPSDAELEERLRAAISADGLPAAVRRLKEETGISRSALYRRALALRQGGGEGEA